MKRMGNPIFPTRNRKMQIVSRIVDSVHAAMNIRRAIPKPNQKGLYLIA